MQQIAATLTGITLGIFVVHLMGIRRESLRCEAGLLLCGARSMRRGWMIYFAAYAFFLNVVIPFRDIAGSEMSRELCWISFVFGISGIATLKKSDVNDGLFWRWIELREKGVVCNNGEKSLFTPWHRMRYCQWLDSKGTLSIWGLEPFKVAHGKVHAINEVLLARTELRDPSGEVLNPEFVRPEAPPEPPENQRRPFQYEIKTLLLLMLFASAAFAWWSTVLHG